MLEMMLKSINKKKSNQKGFTLVELIVVIAILGILAAFAIPKLSGFGESAKVSKISTEHRMLKSALQMAISELPDPTDATAIKAITETQLGTYVEGNEIPTGHTYKEGILTSTYSEKDTLTYDATKGTKSVGIGKFKTE